MSRDTDEVEYFIIRMIQSISCSVVSAAISK